MYCDQKPEGNCPLGRHRHRWKDNIVLDLKEIWCEGVIRLHFPHTRDQWQALEYSNDLLGSTNKSCVISRLPY